MLLVSPLEDEPMSESSAENSIPQRPLLYQLTVLLDLIEQMAYVVEHTTAVQSEPEYSYRWYRAVLLEINEMLADRTQVP